ncbi:MAG: hypothetical protein HYS05_08590 [Acidobacteria bacterium]|nr:hypothetical protein [Acidobacteriota bacterium]
MRAQAFTVGRIGLTLAGLLAVIAGAIASDRPARLAADAPGSAPIAAPTFTRDVAPILFRYCATCHRPGEVAPMSLLSFEEVRPWAKAIKAKVVAREMPPWFADPAASMKLRNERRLSETDIDTVAAWVDAGAPRGEDAHLPTPPVFPAGWQNGTPDYVIEMPVDVELPAEGEIEIQDFFVPVPFPTDRFAQVLEFRPGTPGVLHHGGAYMVDLPAGTRLVNGRALGPDGRQLRRDEIRGRGESVFETQGASKLISFHPGQGIERHPPGVAKRIAAGKFVHFNMHYQPTGRPEHDRTKLGIWFAKDRVTHEVLTQTVSQHFIIEGREAPLDVIMVNGEPKYTELIPLIPPFVGNWRMAAVRTFRTPATLYGLSPHMHLRGKDAKYVVAFPDGRIETVLTIPRYDFNWQLHDELETPLKIPAGSVMLGVAHFDNSVGNRYNPGPEKRVFWSDQSWDEMLLLHIEISVDDQILPSAQP